MHITVSFLAHLRDLTGTGKIDLAMDDPTILDVAEEVGRRYGSAFLDELLENGEIGEMLVIMRNGDITYNLKEKLKEGDEVTFLPPAFGG